MDDSSPSTKLDLLFILRRRDKEIHELKQQLSHLQHQLKVTKDSCCDQCGSLFRSDYDSSVNLSSSSTPTLSVTPQRNSFVKSSPNRGLFVTTTRPIEFSSPPSIESPRRQSPKSPSFSTLNELSGPVSLETISLISNPSTLPSSPSPSSKISRKRLVSQ
ncbi:hypothetical protein GEMRC1_001543 [Eukaryota sp. GEM-RC1]